VNATYEGLIDLTKHQWGFYPSFKEAKLPTHPNFQALLTKYHGTYDPTTGVIIWQAGLDAAGGGGFPGGNSSAQSNPNPLFGQDSFVEVAAVYRSQRIRQEPPSDVLDRLGKIVEKLPEDVQVATPSDRNWILMPSPFVKRGELYEDSVEMLLSPPGRKWTEDIYDFISGLGGSGFTTSGYDPSGLDSTINQVNFNQGTGGF
jgi:hypothetical protein